MLHCSLLVFIASAGTTAFTLGSGSDESSVPVESPERTDPVQIEVEFHGTPSASGLSGSVSYQVLCQGFKIAEGPIWDHANNRLLFSDVNSNEIHCWSSEEGHGVFLEPSGNTGHAP